MDASADVGIGRGIREWPRKKSSERIINWLQKIDREPTELVYRALLARQLNQLMATTVFTAWNVGRVPTVDLDELGAWMQWSRELAGEELGSE